MKTVTIKGVTIGTGRPKICVPLMAKNMEELQEKLVKLQEEKDSYDLLEWRIDFFDDVFQIVSVNDAVQLIHDALPQKPLLVTFRTIQEGGMRPCQYVDYHNLLIQLAKNSAVDLLDVEYHYMGQNGFKLLPKLIEIQKDFIVSTHYFEKTPPYKEMLEVMFQMQKIGARIVKLAVMPKNRQEVFNLLNVTNEMVQRIAVVPIVTMAMGELGKISRICGDLMGSSMTFGSLDLESAPGQLPVGELKEIIEAIQPKE